MIGVFGDIEFSVSTNKIQTFNNLGISSSSRWGEHSSKTQAVLEFGGANLDSLTFNIKSDTFKGSSPESISESLQNYREAGTPNYLFLNGKPLRGKKWVITEFNENWINIDNRGNGFVREFSINLKEYGEEKLKDLIIGKVTQVVKSYVKNIDFDTGRLF